MKLRLPFRLLAAVLAALVFPFTVSSSYGDMSIQGANGYYAEGKCTKKKLSDGSYTYTDTYEWTSLWTDPGKGKYTLSQANGTYKDIQYYKDIIFGWQYVYSRDMEHDCPGSITYTNTLHINEDGGGKNQTWQCSSFDADGNVTTPGVWILADTDGAVARFTNYGDMVVKDSRQQRILKTIDGATENADGTITYDTVYTLQDISSGKSVIDGVSDISFSLSVTNTKSFTYDGGYTAGNGAFLSGSVSVLFDNLENLTFSNNSANIGSIVWAAQSSVWSGDHTGGFYVRNISGTASFNNNTGQLFRNTHSRYENVHELVFANNSDRLFASYNAPLYTEFEGCDKIVFSGNGHEEAKSIITNAGDSIYAGYITFDNCGEIIFSGNTMLNMMFDGATPKITDVGSVKFIGNTVCDGYLIHDIGGTSRDMVISGVTDTFAIEENNLTHTSGYATICNTDTYISGSENKHGKLCSISGNEAYGDFRYSLNGGIFSVSHFDAFRANDNVVDSQVYGLLGNLNLTDVDNITFSGNYLLVDAGYSVGGLLRGENFITDFARLDVNENQVGNEKDVKIWSGLLGVLTIVGNDTDSSTKNSVIDIHNNTFSGKTQVLDERLTVSNVAEFLFKNNVFYCDSTESASSGTMLSDVRISNSGKIEVSNNVGVATNGRAYGGALGGVLNSVNMEEVSVALQNSKEVVIQNNAAVGTEAAFGGAITAPESVYISGNDKVSITGNYAKASTIADLITEEGIGTFADTYDFNGYGKGAMGGAIYVSAGFTTEMGLAIYGNNSATIRGNYITDGNTYQLQGLAIGFGPFERRTDMMLAAPENKTLDLYDPIFASGELRIGITQENVDDFPNYYSAKMLNKGKVVFSAAHARQDLNTIKTAARAGMVTDQEWDASRTSIVRENIYLNSGSVEVRDDAILVSSAFSMGKDTSLIVSSGGVLRTSSFSTGYSPLLDSLSSPNVKIIMDGGSFQLNNDGIYLGATQKVRVLSPSTINANAFFLNSGSSLELVVSAVNKQDACLTINFSESKSFLLPDGYRFASAGSLTLESAEVLGKGQYKLLHFEEYTDSKLLAGFYENCDWADGFIVTGVGTGNSLEWVSNDDCSVDLVWTIGKTVAPPVNPDPEPDEPTPDNPPIAGETLTWANAKKAVWQDGAGGWVEGGVFSAGDEVAFADGNVTIVGAVAPGEVLIAPTKSLTFKSNKKNPGRIAGDASVTIDASPKAKVTMNDGNTYTGGTTIYGGMVKAGGERAFGIGSITLNGGTLDLAGKSIDNAIVLEGSAVIKGGAKYTGDFSMAGGADLMKGSVVNVAAGKTVELSGGRINGTLSGLGSIEVMGDVTLGATGKITTNALTVSDGEFGIGSKGLAMNAKTSSLEITGGALVSEGKLSGYNLSMTGGKLSVSNAKPMAVSFKGAVEASDGAEINVYGGFTAGSLELDGGYLMVKMDSRYMNSKNKPKAQTVSLSNKTETNYVYNSDVHVAGKMNVAGDLIVMGNSNVCLYDPSGKNAAMGLTVKGALLVDDGCNLTMSGALSAGMLLLDGGTITFNGSKPLTIKVGSYLDLESGVDLNFNSGLVNGKTYKILTFKYSNLDDFGPNADFYELLGLDKAACVLKVGSRDISMKVLDADALKGEEAPFAQADETSAELPAAVAVLVNPVLPDYSGVADALVQANWGLVESSRAFVNTIANRSMAVQLGSGERAVWASAIAGSSRRSSSGTHGGADTNITGGAIGMETQLGEGSLLGMALGNSRARVSAHNYGTIKQDTTHLGVYGQTNWNKLSADWSAAYGRSESKSNGSDWSQRAIQLDGRLSYNHALSETVLLRGFGGVQYYASDSARVDGLDTGEVQNLRGEIGVGIVRSTQQSSVYAELALHQDLVRDNPEVRSPFGQRYHGTNPGRTGINFTIGGSYALSDQWSVNASYTAEVVENANTHSVNVGATYKF